MFRIILTLLFAVALAKAAENPNPINPKVAIISSTTEKVTLPKLTVLPVVSKEQLLSSNDAKNVTKASPEQLMEGQSVPVPMQTIETDVKKLESKLPETMSINRNIADNNNNVTYSVHENVTQPIDKNIATVPLAPQFVNLNATKVVIKTLNITSSTTTATTTTTAATTTTTTTSATTTTRKPIQKIKKPLITVGTEEVESLPKEILSNPQKISPVVLPSTETSSIEKVVNVESNRVFPYNDDNVVYNKNYSRTERQPGFIIPLVITIFAVPFLALIGYQAVRRGKEAWRNRHYKRMDYLIEGMYNE